MSDWVGEYRENKQQQQAAEGNVALGGSADRFATWRPLRNSLALPLSPSSYCCFFPTASRFGLVFLSHLVTTSPWTMESVLLVLSYPV